MARKLLSVGAGVFVLAFLSSPARPAEKVNLGVASKLSFHYVMPILAAEEKGLWKENGLELKWVGFTGSVPMHQAVVSRSIDIGYDALPASIQAMSRGLPVVTVAALNRLDYYIWVSPDSPIKEPKDLKGARVGAFRFGGMNHAYGLFLARKFGLEKDIKFVTLGGGEAEIGAIKTGRIQGRVAPMQSDAHLFLRGQVRPAIPISIHFPKEWIDNAIGAPQWLIDDRPDVVRRTLRATAQAVDFMLKNKDWSLKKLSSEFGLTREEAAAIFDTWRFPLDLKFTREAIQNVREFLIDYGIISKEAAPPVEKLYTTRFLQ